MNYALLCTFTNMRDLEYTIDEVADNFKTTDTLFVLGDISDDNNLFVTYNIDKSEISNHINIKTILMHRKKETNTLYTINAINAICINKIGVVDPSYKIDWEMYKNSILLTNNGMVNKIRTKIIKVVNL